MERNSARVYRMKCEEKPFFCQIYAIVWGKMVHVVIDRYFSLFVKGLKIFLNPRLSPIIPLSAHYESIIFNWPVSHSARHQCPARERHKIRVASRENVDNQAPRNTNFTH